MLKLFVSKSELSDAPCPGHRHLSVSLLSHDRCAETVPVAETHVGCAAPVPGMALVNHVDVSSTCPASFVNCANRNSVIMFV